MDPQKPSLLKHALIYGLILGGAIILYSLLLYSLGLMQNMVLGYITFAIMIGVLVWIEIDYRNKKLGGLMTLGQGFMIGFLAVILASILYAIYYYVFVKYIDPNIIEQIIAKSEEKIMESQPNISDADLDKMMGYMEKFMKPSIMVFFGFLWNLFIGTAASLIIAAAVKKVEFKPL